MNCKAGQMAIVARTTGLSGFRLEVVRRLLGRPVRVTAIEEGTNWLLEDPPLIVIETAFCTLNVTVVTLPDELLMPVEGDPVDEKVLDEVAA